MKNCHPPRCDNRWNLLVSWRSSGGCDFDPLGRLFGDTTTFVSIGSIVSTGKVTDPVWGTVCSTDFANVIGSSFSYSGVPGVGGRTLAVELDATVSLLTTTCKDPTHRLVGDASRTLALVSSSSMSLYEDIIS